MTTTPIKTQCPYCDACFKLQKAQLNQADATIRCNLCQQVFLVNKHLIVTTEMVSTNIGTTNILSTDTLIHDDMALGEWSETVLQHDSLDSMNAWLTQTSTTIDPLPVAHRRQRTNSHTPDKNPNLTKNSVATSESKVKNKPKTTVKPVISSVVANDIHNNINKTDDNSWLEQLLKEKKEDQHDNQSDTDLAQLLIKMGVPINDVDEIDQERTSKIQARLQQASPMENRPSIAILLWTMGCMVLVLLLFAQYVIFNLDTLVKNPVYAGRLQTVCKIAACSLPSADLTTLTITDLNHRASRVSTTRVFSDIRATLNNNSAQAQLIPSLKVSVYSPNALIGEFIAMPGDYLLSPQNQLVAEGHKQLMFTIPIADNQISKIIINPIY